MGLVLRGLATPYNTLKQSGDISTVILPGAFVEATKRGDSPSSIHSVTMLVNHQPGTPLAQQSDGSLRLYECPAGEPPGLYFFMRVDDLFRADVLRDTADLNLLNGCSASYAPTETRLTSSGVREIVRAELCEISLALWRRQPAYSATHVQIVRDTPPGDTRGRSLSELRRLEQRRARAHDLAQGRPCRYPELRRLLSGHVTTTLPGHVTTTRWTP